jgi:hypothetical protein
MNPNVKRGSQPSKKVSVTEDMERLKQRREDRKNKGANDEVKEKASDVQYEKLMKKKKIEFDQPPDNVKM